MKDHKKYLLKYVVEGRIRKSKAVAKLEWGTTAVKHPRILMGCVDIQKGAYKEVKVFHGVFGATISSVTSYLLYFSLHIYQHF